MSGSVFYVMRFNGSDPKQGDDEVVDDWNDRPPILKAENCDIVELSSSGDEIFAKYKSGYRVVRKKHWWTGVESFSFPDDARAPYLRASVLDYCSHKRKELIIRATDLMTAYGPFWDLETAQKQVNDHITELGYNPRRKREEPTWSKMGYSDPSGYSNDGWDD